MVRVVIATAMALILPLAAGAQSADPPLSAQEQEAKALFEESTKLYARGSYAEAAQRLERAYELSGRAVLLFNLANAYERKGDFERAAARLRRYLPNAPAAEQPLIRLRIAALEERLEQRREAQQNIDKLQAQIDVLQEQVRKRDQQIATLRAPAPPRPNLLAHYRTEIIVGAAGAVALGAGLVFAVKAKQASNTLESLCENGLCLEDAARQQSKRRNYAIGADISFALGGLALGWVAYRIATDDSPDEGTTVRVQADSETARVVVGGTF
jgi:tetratricopeptide (TPR) repeat protein